MKQTDLRERTDITNGDRRIDVPYGLAQASGQLRRVARRAHDEVLESPGDLGVRSVVLWLGLGLEALTPYVLGDTDHSHEFIREEGAVEGIGAPPQSPSELEALSQRVLARPDPLRHGLIHDHDERLAQPIGRSELPPPQ